MRARHPVYPVVSGTRKIPRTCAREPNKFAQRRHNRGYVYTHVRGNLVTRLKRLSPASRDIRKAPRPKAISLKPTSLCRSRRPSHPLPLFFSPASFVPSNPPVRFREPFSCAKIAPVSAKGQCTVRELADKKIQSRRPGVERPSNSEDPSFCPLSSGIPSTRARRFI